MCISEKHPMIGIHRRNGTTLRWGRIVKNMFLGTRRILLAKKPLRFHNKRASPKWMKSKLTSVAWAHWSSRVTRSTVHTEALDGHNSEVESGMETSNMKIDGPFKMLLHPKKQRWIGRKCLHQSNNEKSRGFENRSTRMSGLIVEGLDCLTYFAHCFQGRK